MNFARIIVSLIILVTLSPAKAKAKAPTAPNPERKSPFPEFAACVVRIQAAIQAPDYRTPWNAGHVSGGSGSGFIMEIPGLGKRIVTNAHVVSNARFITVTREGVNHPFRAKVEFIGHDCDLAMVDVEDAAFYEGARPLTLGGIPAIESTVSVYGYPLGVKRMSVTRGIVSRIDFDLYVHSGFDSHLAIQIDAAINPGNSGGPVIQDGKVVGVAFQGHSGQVAQNMGFMIPTPVIKRFLRDLSKGSYTGYTDYSLEIRPLQSPTARKALGVPVENTGVLITGVHEIGSAHGFLQKDDVLLGVDGHPIACDGRVDLDGESVDMSEVVERKFEGETIRFDVLRGGRRLSVEFPLRGTSPLRMQSMAYDTTPRYLLHGGLLFQPLDRNLVASMGNGDLRIRRTINEFATRHLYLKRPEFVVLNRILPDPVNADCDGQRTGIVDTINGVPIRSLKEVAAAFAKPTEYDVIMLEGIGLPIVLKRAEVLTANPRIMKNYGIASDHNL